LSVRNKKTFFGMGLIVISILSFFLAIDSTRFLAFKDLPESNFFNVTINQFLVSECENTSETCSEEEALILEGTASGVAIASRNGTTYVLTADHFCSPSEFSFFTQDLIKEGKVSVSSDIWVTDDKGTMFLAEIVYNDAKKDLCLLETAAKIKTNMKIATFMPEVGDTIYAISAPYGIRERGVSLHFDGIFSGCDVADMCYYTIPAAGGSSGSLVFDSKGRIVGMIQMTTVGFNAVSLGVGVDTIRQFLIESKLFNPVYF